MRGVAVTLLALCLAGANGASLEPRLELVGLRAGGRIVGGVEATQEQGKHQCSLWASGWFGTQHICGCSLYGDSFAITAAHCTDGFTKDDLTVKYGGLNVNSLDKAVPVAEVRQHEKYNTPQFDNDYSVLKLSQPTVKVPGRVDTVQLADSEPANGAPCQLTGWGNTRGGDSGSSPALLQYQQFEIVSSAECAKIYGTQIQVTAQMICSKHKSSTGCNGDSGGPLMSGGKLVGIVSWGIRNCPADTTVYPAAYANVGVAAGRSWLISKLA